MSKKEKLSHKELKAFSASIQSGLNKMLEFEKKLNEFDKRTLSLFLTLTIKDEHFSETLDVLPMLESILQD